MISRLTVLARLSGILLLATAIATTSRPLPVAASAGLIGSGSSFAGNEMQDWTKAVGAPPYNLSVNYQSSSSGQGRQNFRDGVVDFAVSDIRYNKYDVNPPDPATFEYVPVTAGGLAIMYNLRSHGFTATSKPLQLSSLTLCGIFTDAISYWDDPAIVADNPGVTLPHVAVTPVVRSDPAGTNFVMEEYCIQLHNDLYGRFAAAVTKATSTDYPDEPTSNWPILPPIVAAQGSEGAADTVAGSNNDGYVTAVETSYATLRHMPTASVKNDTGAYVQPTADAVATALSFATQQADGTHVLNFTPGSTGAYNPSTYSYLLIRLTGASLDKGAAITQFAEYCLTVGESHAPALSYASIGRNLILFGLERLKVVPGYVPPTADELAAIPSDSSIAAANGGAPDAGTSAPGGTGGAGPAASSTGGPASSSAGSGQRPTSATPGSGSGAATVGSARAATHSAISGLARSGTGNAVTAAGVDPSASLDASTGPLGQTGIESDLLGGLGGLLLLGGEVGRRMSRRRWRRP